MRTASCLTALCGLATLATAQATYFTDRTAFEAFLGPSAINVSFNANVTDLEFRTEPRNFAFLELRQTGADPGVNVNLVDAPPLLPTGNNGTTNVYAFVRTAAAATPGTQVVIDFSDPVRAFGFDSWAAATNEGVVMEARHNGVVVASAVVGGGLGAFTGFVLESGYATSVVLRGRFIDPQGGGETFTFDNATFARFMRSTSDQNTWNDLAGPMRVTETFGGFGADLEYRTTPRDLAGGYMSIEQAGDPAAGLRNFIDVPAFASTLHNGTSHAAARVNAAEGANPGTQVLIEFDPPAHAFALQSWSASSEEGVTMEVLRNGTVVYDAVLSGSDGAFRGVDIGDGSFTAVRLRSETTIAGTVIGENFGLDNLSVLPRVRWYDNLISWDVAAGIGGFQETFSGFGADTQFRDASVGLAGPMTIRQTGDATPASLNVIDVPPLSAIAPSSGTANALCYVNADNPPSGYSSILIDFQQPVRAFSMQTWGASGGEGAALYVYDSQNVLLDSIPLSDADGAFVGFVLPRLAASYVYLRSRSLIAGATGEVFTIDNIRYKLAPLPCPADLNQDEELTFDDIQVFVAFYNAQDPRADFNDDGEWTFDDVQLFIASYNGGC